MLLNRQAAAYIMLASLPFAEVSVGSGVSLVRYILIAALAVWLISALVFEPFDWLRPDRTDIKVLLWALGSIASAVILNSQAAPGLAQTYLNLVLVFYMASRIVRNPQQTRGAVIALVVGIALVAMLSLALPNLAASVVAEGDVQRLGPLGATGAAGINRFAGWLAVGAVLPWLALNGRRSTTLAARALSIAIVIALVATVSKAALAAAGASVLCWVLISSRRKRVLKGMGAVPILAVGWFLLPAGVHQRFAAFGQANSVAYTRFAIWEGGLKMFLAHPLFGVGVGQFDQYAPLYFPQLTTYQEAQESHSVLIGALAETGAVGTLLLLIMVGSILAEGIRLIRADWRASTQHCTTPGVALRSELSQAFSRLTSGIFVGYIAFLVVSMSVDLQRDRFFVALAGLVHGLYRARARHVS